MTEKNVWLTSDFREGETVQMRDRSYPNVGGKLRILRENYPDADVTTDIHTLHDDFVIVKATVRHGERAAAAYGTANLKADARLKDNLLELAETRAIARALRFYGIGVDATGHEEVQGKPDFREPGKSRAPRADGDEVTLEQKRRLRELVKQHQANGHPVNVHPPETRGEAQRLIHDLEASA